MAALPIHVTKSSGCTANVLTRSTGCTAKICHKSMGALPTYCLGAGSRPGRGLMGCAIPPSPALRCIIWGDATLHPHQSGEMLPLIAPGVVLTLMDSGTPVRGLRVPTPSEAMVASIIAACTVTRLLTPGIAHTVAQELQTRPREIRSPCACSTSHSGTCTLCMQSVTCALAKHSTSCGFQYSGAYVLKVCSSQGIHHTVT
jgi:hypothetical protein